MSARVLPCHTKQASVMVANYVCFTWHFCSRFFKSMHFTFSCLAMLTQAVMDSRRGASREVTFLRNRSEVGVCVCTFFLIFQVSLLSFKKNNLDFIQLFIFYYRLSKGKCIFPLSSKFKACAPLGQECADTRTLHPYVICCYMRVSRLLQRLSWNLGSGSISVGPKLILGEKHEVGFLLSSGVEVRKYGSGFVCWGNKLSCQNEER